jgi:hypothetical protein
MLGAEEARTGWRIRVFGPHALPSRLDHLFRCVAGNNGNVMPGKKERIFPGAAIDFQDMGSPGFKGVEKHIPYSSALGTADHGARKQVVIPRGEAVKRQDRLILNFGDGHASTSERDESSPARALFNAMAKAGCAFGVCRRCAGQAGKLHFLLKKPVGVTVKLLRMPALDLQIAIGAGCPRLQLNQAIRHLLVVRRSLDRIRDRGKEDIGLVTC